MVLCHKFCEEWQTVDSKDEVIELLNVWLLVFLHVAPQKSMVVAIFFFQAYLQIHLLYIAHQRNWFPSKSQNDT